MSIQQITPNLIANSPYLLKGITYLTSGTSATYTTPAGVRALYVECVGGGGGGGGVDGDGTNAAGGGGGGAGGYCAKLITNPSASYTYTVGAGGAGGAAGANGGAGGSNTTFTDGTLTLTGSGGNGGSGQVAAATITFYNDTDGGAASGGDINSTGGHGTGRNRGALAATRGGSGGTSFFGAGGIGGYGSAIAEAGFAATSYGGGGGGGAVDGVTSNVAGGNGYQGVIRITEYY